MKPAALFGAGIALIVVSFAALADTGQIIATSNLGDLCKSASATHRKTLVYVDLSAINRDESEWGLAILNKLELGPREPLTVLGVNSGTFEVTEFFDSCYPTLTKKEIEAARSGRSLWQSLTEMDPEAQQRENIQTFETHLRGSLNKLIGSSVKIPDAKRRNVLGAIALDKNRFADSRALYRIIIYANGTIVEPSLPSGSSDEQLMRFLTEKYATGFSGAEVYVYGVSGEADRSLEARSKIFSAFFLNNWGLMRSFGSSLPQQRNALFDAGLALAGSFEGGGAKGNAKLTFTPGAGREIARAWLTFLVGTNSIFVPFEGEYGCDKEKCDLKGAALENAPIWSKTPYFRKGDRLVLSGGQNADLEGSLQPATREVFQEGAKDKTVQYQLKFRRE